MLALDQTLALLDAARRAAAVPMSFAVMDAGGHLLALTRMDGARGLLRMSHRARPGPPRRTAPPAPRRRRRWRPCRASQAITAMTHGRYTPQTGAVPVYRDGELLGGIGASGGTGEQDEAACTAAVTEQGLSLSG